jgi:HSP90 family molecular chaperone
MNKTVVVGLVCFFAGVVIRPPSTVDERIVTVIREVSHKETTENKTSTIKSTGTIKRLKKTTPNGTIEIEEIGPVVEKTLDEKKSQVEHTEKQQKTEIVSNKKQWSLGVTVDPISLSQVEVIVSRRVLGDLFLTATAESSISNIEMPEFRLGVSLMF